MNCKMILGCLALAAGASAQAAGPVKIGFIATLSTPAGYIGEDERDAFNLAIQQGGGKLGGVPVELVIEDDGLKPANAKQAADRLLQSGVRLYTGVNFSNVLAAVVPGVVKSGAFYVSLNPGPSNFAGEKCDPNYFVASYQNDAFHTAGGVAANELGYKRVVLLAPNYQAGRDAIEGFKRTYKGEVAAEIYTKLDQSDFGRAGAAAFAGARRDLPVPSRRHRHQLRQAVRGGRAEQDHPHADAQLLDGCPHDPGHRRRLAGRLHHRHLVDGLRQSAVQGLRGSVQEGLWPRAHRLRHAGLRHGPADRRGPEGHRRRPVQGGRIPRRAAQARVRLLRGKFSMNVNQHPIQDLYLMRVEKGADGSLSPRLVRKLVSDDKDAYAQLCKMPS